MNKKRLLIATISIFILSVLFHLLYDKFPNFITSIIAPVNESIFEHNKMILSSYFVYSLIEEKIFKTGKSSLFMNFIGAIICIILINVFFSFIYLVVLKTNDNIVLTLLIYFISISISLALSHKFVIEKNKKITIISLLGFLSLYILLGILTYFPPKIDIFYDFTQGIYGIK